MKKTIGHLIVIGLGLFLSSCSSNPTPVLLTTKIVLKTLTPTLSPVSNTSTPTSLPPVVNNPSGETDGLIITLGERVNQQAFWPAIPAFSNDGKMIALVSQKVRLWNVKTHELLQEFVTPHSDCYTQNVIFSTNSKLLATSIYCLTDKDWNSPGHVLIWDTTSGNLLQDWEQKFSRNTSKVDGISNSYPATGIAFLPNSSLLAYASGNNIGIKDIQKNDDGISLKLPNDMIASDIAISDDGKLLFAFMDFNYYNTPNTIAQKYAVQILDLQSKNIVEKIDFPEAGNIGFFIDHSDVEMKLSGKFLASVDYINETFKVKNLESGETKNLHYLGDMRTFISQDANYAVSFPTLATEYCNNQNIELWNLNLNQSLHLLHTFIGDFGREWCYAPNTIIFNPDNTMLAIAHEERVSLWDISHFTKPKENLKP